MAANPHDWITHQTARIEAMRRARKDSRAALPETWIDTYEPPPDKPGMLLNPISKRQQAQRRRAMKEMGLL